MKRFEIGVKNHETFNELIYLNINDTTYIKEELTKEVIELTTALSYVEEHEIYNVETYYNLSQYILGYETVVTALNKIHELGYDIIPYYQLSRLIRNMYKHNCFDVQNRNLYFQFLQYFQ